MLQSKQRSGNTYGKITKNKYNLYIPKRKNAINVQLITKESILITAQIIDENLKVLLKKMQATYDNEEKGWIMPKGYFQAFKDSVKKEREEINFEFIPDNIAWILKPFGKILKYIEKREQIEINYLNDKPKNLEDLPPFLLSKLYDFQKKGIQFGLKNCGRLLIADEMGVGKTIQAIALAKLYEEDWPFLIVTPSSLKFNWRDELRRWLDDIMERDIQMVNKSAIELKKHAKFIIISYDIAARMGQNLENYGFKAAILDEAHYLKNSSAKRTETLVPIIKKCRRILLLTGTPAFARPKELYNLLNILRPDVFYAFKDFGVRYCDPKPSRWSRAVDYDGASNTKELHFILQESIMIRRLKKDVLKELPEKRRQKIEVAVDNKIINEIQSLLNDKENRISSNFFTIQDILTNIEPISSNGEAQQGNGSILSIITKCYSLTGIAKIKGTQEYLRDIIQNDIKFIVFAHHIDMLDAIEEEIKSNKILYIRIDGQVKSNKRHESVQEFQTNPKCKVAILSLTAASVGLNLTAASTVIFAEMHWTPAIMIQAEDRAHRIGQKEKNSVNCHYLYGEGTLDSIIYEKLQEKLAVVSDMIDGQFINMDVEEINGGRLGNINIWEDDQFSKTKVFETQSDALKSVESKDANSFLMKKSKDIIDCSSTKMTGFSTTENPKSGKIVKNPFKMKTITEYFQSKNKAELNNCNNISSFCKTSIDEQTNDNESINLDEIDRLLMEEKKPKHDDYDDDEAEEHDSELAIIDELLKQDNHYSHKNGLYSAKTNNKSFENGSKVFEEWVSDSEGFLKCVDQIIEKEKKNLPSLDLKIDNAGEGSKFPTIKAKNDKVEYANLSPSGNYQFKGIKPFKLANDLKLGQNIPLKSNFRELSPLIKTASSPNRISSVIPYNKLEINENKCYIEGINSHDKNYCTGNLINHQKQIQKKTYDYQSSTKKISPQSPSKILQVTENHNILNEMINLSPIMTVSDTKIKLQTNNEMLTKSEKKNSGFRFSYSDSAKNAKNPILRNNSIPSDPIINSNPPNLMDLKRKRDNITPDLTGNDDNVLVISKKFKGNEESITTWNQLVYNNI